MKFIFDMVKGIIIGSGAILPGISSGVICVTLGIYESLLYRVANFFKAPWENLKFFTPYIIGGAIGVVLVGRLLLFLFENYNTPTCFVFIGLILGCFPSVLKQARNARNNVGADSIRPSKLQRSRADIIRPYILHNTSA